MSQIASILLERGLVTQRDLEQASALKGQMRGNSGLALIRIGAVSERDMLQALASAWRLPILDSAHAPALEAVREAVEETGARLDWLKAREAILWFAGEGEARRLHVATRDPLDPMLQEAAEQWSREPAHFHLAALHTIENLLNHLSDSEVAESVFAAEDERRLREMAEEAPVIDFVNAMFGDAIVRRASDIHVEPFADEFVVRMRIDGVLEEWRTSARNRFDAVASRLKLLSGMDIAERRLPQDGRQSIRVNGREMDLRVSSLPTSWGESLVIRLLGKTSNLPELSQLGVRADHEAALDALIAHPNGVILITGPTGSGKTTTIYRLLTKLNDGVRKIITVEDPVELDLPGVVQVPVKADIGLSFAAGLRSILRQDPDVIMVGEIRDAETAKIAVQAALTGHLVISTVHTNSALAAPPRLIDLGVEDYLLGDVLRGVVGQRLVRRLCDACARAADSDAARVAEERAASLGVSGGSPRWREAHGCQACGQTGFRGRVGIYEVFPISKPLQDAIRVRAPEADLVAIARSLGWRSMQGDGVLKARAGETTIQEILRVVGD